MDTNATVGQIEAALDELGAADPSLRARVEELIRLLMQLYGAGLTRALEIVGRESAERLAEDKLVGSLLLLHGLHPVDASTRIAEALRRVQRRLDGHNLRLEELTDGRARVRVILNGGRPPATLASAIEHAIAETAPDVASVEIEGLPEAQPALVQIAPAMGD